MRPGLRLVAALGLLVVSTAAGLLAAILAVQCGAAGLATLAAWSASVAAYRLADRLHRGPGR